MIITCPNCQTGFNLDETRLGPQGSKVRCSRCQQVFTAFPPGGEPPVTEADVTPTPPPPPPPPDESVVPEAPPAAAEGPVEEEPPLPVQPPPPRRVRVGNKRRGGLAGLVAWVVVWLILLAGGAYGALVFVHHTPLFPRVIEPVRRAPAYKRVVGLIQRVPYLRYPFVPHGLDRAVEGWVRQQADQVPWLRGALESRASHLPPPRIRARAEMTIIQAQGSFVPGARAGPLFVVQGKIRNIGAAPVSFIRVKGVLYVRDQRRQNIPFGKPVLAYAGVVLTPQELKLMTLDMIRRRMNNRYGDDRMNYLVKPGQEISFMIVFHELPPKANPSEYTAQLYSSVAGTMPEQGDSLSGPRG